MSVIATGTTIAKLPWSEIASGGQILIELADKLFKKLKDRKNRISIDERVSLLEKNEEQQAKLIKELIARQNSLVAEIGFLRLTLFIFITVTLVLFATFGAYIVVH